MSGIVKTILDILQKAGYLSLEYGQIFSSYILKFLKQRMQSWKKCSLHKGLTKAQGKLGSEIYARYKEGQTDWLEMPEVKQALQRVEEAEALLFQVDQVLAEIERSHESKKEAIREKYSAKRANMGADDAS